MKSLWLHAVLVLTTLGYSMTGIAMSKPHTSACEQTLSRAMCAKIGQMLIVGFGGHAETYQGDVTFEDADHLRFSEASLIAEHIRDEHIGGIILFSRAVRQPKTHAYIRERNIMNQRQVAKLNDKLSKYSHRVRAKQNLVDLPLFISLDQEGGAVDRIPTYKGFKHASINAQSLGNKERAAHKHPEKVKAALAETQAVAEDFASLLNKMHFNLSFSPVVDVNIDPTSPAIGARARSFSSDPKIVYDQANVWIRAHHKHNILTALKHFPGHGSANGDTHLGMVDVTKTYVRDKELAPYQDLIAHGYRDMIMSAHVINGVLDKTQCKPGAVDDPNTWCPATMSKKIISQLLRDKMRYQGVVISDDMSMGAIRDHFKRKDAIKRALDAGVDMFILANNQYDNTEAFYNTIAELLLSGQVTPARIDESYQRIKALKLRLKQNKLARYDA